jgi:hypothetical protein
MRVSAEMMGASEDQDVLNQGALLRRRLTTALQAVHQRNEVHITARELKAALSYIFFGVHYCEDLHLDITAPSHVPADFAFDPGSQLRQGDLLRELTRLDPALEAHARIDRCCSRRRLRIEGTKRVTKSKCNDAFQPIICLAGLIFLRTQARCEAYQRCL